MFEDLSQVKKFLNNLNSEYNTPTLKNKNGILLINDFR